MSYRYIFGPVPSRRLGRSLGVDLVPHKTCSFNCVYCECGRTTLLTNERAEYVPTSELLAELKKIQRGRMWLEIFIIPGVNDCLDHIEKIKHALHQIKPDLVQLNTLDRPGTENWVAGMSQEQLEKVASKLEWQTEIIAKFPDRKASKAYQHDIESAILEMIKRRPCTLEDLSQMLGLHVNEVNKYLDVLMKTGQIHDRKMERGLFYWAKASKISNR